MLRARNARTTIAGLLLAAVILGSAGALVAQEIDIPEEYNRTREYSGSEVAIDNLIYSFAVKVQGYLEGEDGEDVFNYLMEQVGASEFNLEPNSIALQDMLEMVEEVPARVNPNSNRSIGIQRARWTGFYWRHFRLDLVNHEGWTDSDFDHFEQLVVNYQQERVRTVVSYREEDEAAENIQSRKFRLKRNQQFSKSKRNGNG